MFPFCYYNVIYKKVIIAETTMSDWGWLRNGIHKRSANSNLHAFFGWTVIVIFYLFDQFQQELS